MRGNSAILLCNCDELSFLLGNGFALHYSRVRHGMGMLYGGSTRVDGFVVVIDTSEDDTGDGGGKVMGWESDGELTPTPPHCNAHC